MAAAAAAEQHTIAQRTRTHETEVSPQCRGGARGAYVRCVCVFVATCVCRGTLDREASSAYAVCACVCCYVCCACGVHAHMVTQIKWVTAAVVHYYIKTRARAHSRFVACVGRLPGSEWKLLCSLCVVCALV